MLHHFFFSVIYQSINRASIKFAYRSLFIKPSNCSDRRFFGKKKALRIESGDLQGSLSTQDKQLQIRRGSRASAWRGELQPLAHLWFREEPQNKPKEWTREPALARDRERKIGVSRAIFTGRGTAVVATTRIRLTYNKDIILWVLLPRARARESRRSHHRRMLPFVCPLNYSRV